MCLKTAPKPENRNYDHFTPIPGQGSVLSKRLWPTSQVIKEFLGLYGVAKSAGFLQFRGRK